MFLTILLGVTLLLGVYIGYKLIGVTLENKKMVGLKMKYFVLKPEGNTEYHRASRKAIETYANEIAATNPMLSKDLLEWISVLEKSLP